MTAKTSNPAARAGAGRARDCIAVAANCFPEIPENFPDLYKIRVAHLARRHRLSPIVAAVIAEITFHVEARG